MGYQSFYGFTNLASQLPFFLEGRICDSTAVCREATEMNVLHLLPRHFSLVMAIAGLCLMGGLILTGCGNGNDGDTSIIKSKFAGEASCVTCHSEKHSHWSRTAHAKALDTLEAIGQDDNTVCLRCHTVGSGNEGFVSREATPELAGVQCENCHGAAVEHVANPANASLRPTVDQSAALCGTCHTDPHHPTFDEWQLSKHAMALEGLRSSGFTRDSCLECHSQDYRHAIEEQREGKEVAIPTIATAQLSIECVTCHSPHGGVAQDHQLRQPVINLCGGCHTVEEATLGDSPHHPQFEMLTGTGVFQADGNVLMLTHFHSRLAAVDARACAQCHVAQHEVEEPDEGNPNVTGHTFNPFDESITMHQASQYTGCVNCHTDGLANAFRTELQSDVTTRLDALAPRFDSENDLFIDPASLSEAEAQQLAIAKFNFQFIGADGSRGVHNPTLARGALDVAEEIIGELTTP